MCASSQTTRSQRQSGACELLLHVLVARELVEPGDDEVVLEEPVAGAGGFELVVGQDLERQVEAAVELVLPLLGEAAGADDEAALQVAAGDQLLDQQPGHDRLAGAGVVGEQEAQRLARQHRLVDGRDLVRQRLDERGVDREHRIEQVREADAVRLGDEAEERAVAVEAPRAALLDDLEARLVVAVEELVGDPARRRLVGELERVGAEPLDADDGDERVGQDAADRRRWAGGLRVSCFTDRGIGLRLFSGHGGFLSFLGFRRAVLVKKQRLLLLNRDAVPPAVVPDQHFHHVRWGGVRARRLCATPPSGPVRCGRT